MRRLFGWAAGLVGIAALARLLGRRQHRQEEAPTVDPAAELRRTLEHARAAAEPAVAEPSAERPASAEPQSEDEAPPRETLEERRARVHAKAQEALDEMRGDHT